MKKNKKTNKGRKRVTFSCELTSVKEVFLLGDFNQWNPKAHPMEKTADNIWQRSLLLEPGTYEYKFLADGQWKNDPDNFLLCDNGFGTKNNFVHVGDPF